MSQQRFPNMVNAGADALMVQFADGISLEANQQVLQFCQQLQQAQLPILDMVPSYSSVLVYYNVLVCNEAEMRQSLQSLLQQEQQQAAATEGKAHVIDVYYGNEVGPDLERISELKGLAPKQLIAAHTQQQFRVYALGFAPGFAYMGILPDNLTVPRLERPREKIPAGSVAVAEQQTAVYPIASPGGWNIIGRTAKPMYQPQQGIISELAVGDTVTFRAISRDEFAAAGGNLEALDD